MNRRTFLATSASTAFAMNQATAAPKKIAAIITEYRPMSHADVIVGKYLEGFNQDNQPPYPRSKIVSMFTEQIPKQDMSRERAKKFNVPIFRTVADALTLGGDKLAVDGVLLIGEHGDYPTNDKAQKLYPRFEMFLKITDVFRQTGRGVPVFNDKHLSWNWRQAKRMVDISRELRFPMLAGSSAPVAQRIPAIDAPFGAKQTHAVAISYSGLDIYGFHLLEALQCMVERRKGGETGVRSVQCLQNEDCWNFIDKTAWANTLFENALSRSNTRKPDAPRDLVKDPAVFIIDYNDGLKAAAFLMTGMVEDFTVALNIEGKQEPVSTLMNLQNGRPHHHFGCLVQNIEKMFETGKPPYPVERTLLTSGILDFALESRIQGYKKLETPQLAQVRYQTTDASHFCTKGWGPDGKRLD
ncbi:MAG TPA: hypothetical protein VEX68_10650 [Bryobacteraceae bacterium]|nr:hypothetical protein [Bryobacteraceae bacterium]